MATRAATAKTCPESDNQSSASKEANAVFGGDGYSEEWHKMAVEERGLKNIPTTADALPVYHEQAVIDLFDNTGVFSPVELESRYEVYAEQYILTIEVETKLVINMATTQIYPAALTYLSELGLTSSSMADLGIELDASLAKSIATEANSMMAGVTELSKVIAKAYEMGFKFDSWGEHFDFNKWMDAFKECEIDPDFYSVRKRSYDEVLPWDHIDTGIDKKFLIKEAKKAEKGETTEECRIKCSNCGLAEICINKET
jgi:hypothetical protein